MRGVLVANRQINLFAMDHTREVVLHQLFLLLMNLKQ